jgi:HSP20 family protein
MLTLSRAVENAAEARDVWSADRPARQEFWFPPMDTYETENTFVIELDVPGVHPENVDISYEQSTLTIKGTRGATIKAQEKGELRVFSSERLAGAFARAIRLPEYVDGERIEARYANGVLTVTIPKAAAAMPRKIAVKSAE